MLKRYKEIIYGLLLGLAMWVVDAAMHVQLDLHDHSSSAFLDELLRPGATQLLFRSFFLIIAVAFGWALWRSNWRERELHALEDAIVAFHRQLDSPAMRIMNHARMLHGRPGVMHDEIARELAESISDDARVIDQLALAYMRFSEQVRAGQTGEAIETLRRIEAWTINEHIPTSTPSPDGSSSSS
ncbi:MAG: hypothetical protein M3458_02755 [Acidobacteriota bacterium]|nr:hypothetical protein [Acidobacteriota bacterium]MDQ3649199.1 hypothetical protein [Acidobacteriota bacterium]